MNRRRRRWIVAGLVVLAAAAIELGLRYPRSPSPGVLIVNGGEAPIVGLAAAQAGGTVLGGDLAPGKSALLRLDGGGQDVAIEYSQEGNAAGGFRIGGEELEAARRDGFRMVFVIKPNDLQRYQEFDQGEDDPSPLVRLFRRALARLDAGP